MILKVAKHADITTLTNAAVWRYLRISLIKYMQQLGIITVCIGMFAKSYS